MRSDLCLERLARAQAPGQPPPPTLGVSCVAGVARVSSSRPRAARQPIQRVTQERAAASELWCSHGCLVGRSRTSSGSRPEGPTQGCGTRAIETDQPKPEAGRVPRGRPPGRSLPGAGAVERERSRPIDPQGPTPWRRGCCQAWKAAVVGDPACAEQGTGGSPVRRPDTND